jgi:hypothetical protein
MMTESKAWSFHVGLLDSNGTELSGYGRKTLPSELATCLFPQINLMALRLPDLHFQFFGQSSVPLLVAYAGIFNTESGDDLLFKLTLSNVFSADPAKPITLTECYLIIGDASHIGTGKVW